MDEAEDKQMWDRAGGPTRTFTVKKNIKKYPGFIVKLMSTFDSSGNFTKELGNTLKKIKVFEAPSNLGEGSIRSILIPDCTAALKNCMRLNIWLKWDSTFTADAAKSN